MKITMIGTLPPIKALSPYCFHLAEALSKKIDLEFINFRSSLPNFLYLGGMKDKSEGHYTLKNVKIRSILNLYNPLSWIKAGLLSEGNLIHIQHWAVYSSLIYCFILPILKIRGKKCILTVHNITPHTDDFFTKFFDRLLNKIIFSLTDVFIVHNKRNREKFLDIYRIYNKKIYITTHGALYPYQKIKNISNNKAREYLNITIDKKLILFFGYVWDYKGLDVLLNALEKIKETDKDIILIIAGQPLKNWNKYQNIIDEKNLENYIIKKLKYIPDSEIEYFFSCVDLVVLPYKKHPFDTHGGVGALALSFKKPMIVTDTGGLPEYVKNKEMIVPTDNPNLLAKKIIQVLQNNKLLEKLSKDSENLSKILSWDNIAEKTLEIYKNSI